MLRHRKIAQVVLQEVMMVSGAFGLTVQKVPPFVERRIAPAIGSESATIAGFVAAGRERRARDQACRGDMMTS